MTKWLGPLAFAILLGITAHFAVLYAAPGFIMGRAIVMLEEGGSQFHEFTLAERMTPQTQSVVRASPDLAYSVCLYDLAKAPNGIGVNMGAFEGYSSISFFDAQTNNFYAVRGDGEAKRLILLPPGDLASGENLITSPSERGIILIRRLAPTQEQYGQVVKASKGDSCAAIHTSQFE